MSPAQRRSKTTTAWIDVVNAGTVVDFARKLGIQPDFVRLPNKGVLILPNHSLLVRQPTSSIVFPQSTKDVLTTLRGAGIETLLYDDGRERRELILRYSEIVSHSLWL